MLNLRESAVRMTCTLLPVFETMRAESVRPSLDVSARSELAWLIPARQNQAPRAMASGRVTLQMFD